VNPRAFLGSYPFLISAAIQTVQALDLSQREDELCIKPTGLCTLTYRDSPRAD
jgi:hypothetical protein